MSERKLTPREIEVLQATADGEECLSAGQVLGLTVNTVKKMRCDIMLKLGAETIAQAVAMGIRRNLIQCIAIALIASTLSGCATIHRHPKLTALTIGAAAGLAIGLATYQKPCPHYIDGFGYDGTRPCPKSCEGPGDCYWPGKK